MAGMVLIIGDAGKSAVAIYGAVTATVAILVSGVSVWWNIHRDRRTKKIRVDVRLRAGVAAPAEGTVEILIIQAVNRSDFAVAVAAAGLELRNAQRFAIVRPFYSELPVDLPLNTGSADIMVQLDSVVHAVSGFDLAEPRQAYVTLKSGETFRSHRKRPAAKR